MKSLHVYFPDKVAVINVDDNDAVIKKWPASQDIRKIIKADTYKECGVLATKDDRSVERYILYRVRRYFKLIPS